MKNAARPALLLAATILMFLTAALYAVVAVPHLREDMIEISVRPTLLGAVSLGLWLGAFALFGFALIVFAATVDAVRGRDLSRASLGIIAAIYAAFGIIAFATSRSPHTLGYVVIGALIGTAAAVPQERR